MQYIELFYSPQIEIYFINDILNHLSKTGDIMQLFTVRMLYLRWVPTEHVYG